MYNMYADHNLGVDFSFAIFHLVTNYVYDKKVKRNSIRIVTLAVMRNSPLRD